MKQTQQSKSTINYRIYFTVEFWELLTVKPDVLFRATLQTSAAMLVF